jgi:pimeloyl-ACP methyl ester carboxylesterase
MPSVVAATPTTRRVRLRSCELRYARTGTGPPVVLMHTLRTQLEYLAPLVAELDPTRLDVIAVDLPGHGESTAAPVEHTATYFTDAIEELLDALALEDAILAGDSIGATIALLVAARRNARVRGVVAVNPYDYGTRGGVRRNSALANVLFSMALLPGIGPVAVRLEQEWMIRRVLRSGMRHPDRLPGHARAFRSLLLGWRTWIRARAEYDRIAVPVVLAYGTDDWATPEEREANGRAIPHASTVELARTGHFAALDAPAELAELVARAAAAA